MVFNRATSFFSRAQLLDAFVLPELQLKANAEQLFGRLTRLFPQLGIAKLAYLRGFPW